VPARLEEEYNNEDYWAEEEGDEKKGTWEAAGRKPCRKRH